VVGGRKVYTGQWSGCDRHGEGELVTPFSTYTGQWGSDEKRGYGSQVTSNGTVYEGVALKIPLKHR